MNFQFKALLSAFVLILLHSDHGTGLFSYLGMGWLSEGYHTLMRPIYHNVSPVLFVVIFSFALALLTSIRFNRVQKA